MTAANGTMQDTGMTNGILPGQDIRQMIANGEIAAATEMTPAQMQPASIDLRLGRRAWRVQSSFLPGSGTRVEDKLDRLGMHQLDLEGGAVLERGCVYIVELQESLRLPEDVSAMANPKSSTGRLDIFTRLITDGASEFEAVAAGYEGPLYAEISPRTFSVLVRPGSCDLSRRVHAPRVARSSRLIHSPQRRNCRNRPDRDQSARQASRRHVPARECDRDWRCATTCQPGRGALPQVPGANGQACSQRCRWRSPDSVHHLR